MTKVMANIKGDDVYMDVLNHADDHDVCTIISTLCNVLINACLMHDVPPIEYKAGHVRIDVPNADDDVKAVFTAVYSQIMDVAAQYPDSIRIY